MDWIIRSGTHKYNLPPLFLAIVVIIVVVVGTIIFVLLIDVLCWSIAVAVC